MPLLKATKRDALGTRKARRLRQNGNIPGIIYGHGEQAVPVTLSEHDVELVVLHGERLLEVELDGETHNVLIKEVQYDTFGQDVLHVDLTRVRLDERVEVTVPIVLRGRPAGLDEGGVLHQMAPEATIECVVTGIPDDLRVNVADLKVGDSLHMRDLPLPEGATLLEEPEVLVCSVTVVAEEEEAPAEEAAAEPEVIGEKKEGEEAAPADEQE